jgi:pentatricopeptide repeat protein
MINAVRKALELDPDVAEAHVLFAYTLQEEWQWTQAETEYKRALELAPNDARTQAGYAWWLGCHGRLDEGISWVRRARGLDPIAVSGNDVSWILSQAHRFDEAIRESRSAQAVRPDDASVLWFLGFALLGKGQAAEAIPFLERATTVSHGSPGTVGVLISAYARAGRRNDALRLLAELKERREKGYVPAGAFVIAYLGLDDKEAAFVWLERAYLEKSNILQWVKTNPVFDPIRGDPRFEDLIRRVGLGEGNSTEAVHQSRRGPGSRIVPRSASDATPKRW